MFPVGLLIQELLEEDGHPHTSLPLFFWTGAKLMHFEVLCDEGGYTNELFVGLETYMTVGQGGAGVTGCLDIHSRGERGPEFNSPTRESE